VHNNRYNDTRETLFHNFGHGFTQEILFRFQLLELIYLVSVLEPFLSLLDLPKEDALDASHVMTRLLIMTISAFGD
jgi:hypothetical protein